MEASKTVVLTNGRVSEGMFGLYEFLVSEEQNVFRLAYDPSYGSAVNNGTSFITPTAYTDLHHDGAYLVIEPYQSDAKLGRWQCQFTLTDATNNTVSITFSILGDFDFATETFSAPAVVQASGWGDTSAADTAYLVISNQEVLSDGSTKIPYLKWLQVDNGDNGVVMWYVGGYIPVDEDYLYPVACISGYPTLTATGEALADTAFTTRSCVASSYHHTDVDEVYILTRKHDSKDLDYSGISCTDPMWLRTQSNNTLGFFGSLNMLSSYGANGATDSSGLYRMFENILHRVP